MRKWLWVAIVGLVLLGGIVKAGLPVPGLLNEVLEPRAEDVSFAGLPVEEAEPELVWQLFLPWSKDGLGHGEKYLGAFGLGMYVDAAPPARLVVGPGDIIAVQDGWDTRTRLYDREGRFLGLREGYPLGFTPNGGLITFSPVVRRYDPSGNLLWERDPHAEAKRMLGLPESSPTELVGGYSTAFASPWGDVYCSVRIGRYTAGTCLSPDEQGVELPQWVQTDEFHVGVIYDADGKLVRFVSEGIPGGLVFTPSGTAFATAVPEDNMWAHREFQIRDGQFTLRRTIRLPNYSIFAVGQDGSVVARDPGLPTPFTVYREGSRKAVRFILPGKHMDADTDFEGHIYSMEVQQDGLVIACWKWPVPQ